MNREIFQSRIIRKEIPPKMSGRRGLNDEEVWEVTQLAIKLPDFDIDVSELDNLPTKAEVYKIGEAKRRIPIPNW